MRFLRVLRPQDAGPDRTRCAVRPPGAARGARARAGRQRDDQGSLGGSRHLERPAVAVRARHAADRRDCRSHRGRRVSREARHGAGARARAGAGRADGGSLERDPGRAGLRAATRARRRRGLLRRRLAPARRRRRPRRRGHRGARRPSLRPASDALVWRGRHEPRQLLRLQLVGGGRPAGPRRGLARGGALSAMSLPGPRNPFQSPRFGQIATFMLLPAAADATGLDVALLGVPYDGGTSYRSGARFGPRAVREQSSLIRPWNPVLKVHPFERLRVADCGDVDVVPISIERTFEAVKEHGTAWAAERLARLRGGPVYCSFDIDAVDPAYAPATGTPEVGGLTSFEALTLVRALAGHSLVGADVVEVSPPYDGPGQITSLLAANLMFELVSVLALGR